MAPGDMIEDGGQPAESTTAVEAGTQPEGSDPAPSTNAETDRRVFLLVVDETEELQAAIRYACGRAARTGGRVALLHVVEPVEMEHFMFVGNLMRDEARDTAENRLQTVAALVAKATRELPTLYVREGKPWTELVRLIEEEPGISNLVLAASPAGDGPGPLISALCGKQGARLRVPVTIVPGDLTAEQIDRVT